MSLSFSTWRAGGYANAAVPRRADPASLQQLGGQTMGTTWSLRFDNPQMLPLAQVREAVEAALTRVIAQMSHWEPDSLISRFNAAPAGSRHALPAEFAQVMQCALAWAQASGGAIDPTVGALVARWGFGPAASLDNALPLPEALAAVHAHVGWQRLTLDETDYTLLQPGGVQLDLSGIAKGFAVDHGVDALRALGLTDLLFEIGGELRGIGRRPGGAPWQVQVDTEMPTPQRIALADMAVATSGDRWHRRAIEGRSWS
ncbi:MAG: FAD:protein FMN transferase, partial [Variovorax sp.]|nr:FAD:protein FMN transferase [Variovorax sp.]